MTTLKRIELTCPNCEQRFSSEVIDLMETSGRKHTDFQLTTGGMAPERYDVHLCARCGFAGPEAWFTDREGVSDTVHQRVWNELAPQLAAGAVAVAVAASEKWEFAAKVATWDGASARQIGDLWLRAAWCSVDDGDVEAERYYRILAARSFEDALSTYDGVEPLERAVITYLVGELWRRIGDSARANSWFDTVDAEVVDRYAQRWIARAAKQQHTAPREWFG